MRQECCQDFALKINRLRAKRKKALENRACHGPVLVGRPGVGPVRHGPSFFRIMGLDPARPIKFSFDGP